MEKQISFEIDSNHFIIDVSGMEELPIPYHQETAVAGDNILVNNINGQPYNHETASYKLGSRYRKK